MEWTQFFDTTKVPENFEKKQQNVDEFIQRNQKQGRNIVLVSSGGTTVPLESRTVRYIDNFSVGTRGSASAEHFLRHGYAVIFLHRKGSLEPFRRHFMHTNFLDMLDMPSPDGSIQVRAEQRETIAPLLVEYQQACVEGLLLQVDFTTLADYLHLLRAISQHLRHVGSAVMFYLAAAVSDFYIPAADMPEHKLQSSAGPLQISLQLVPKMLQPLVSQWVPHAFIVSFKLETDPEMLIPKAKQALRTYSHQLVVANILETRKQEVVMVTAESQRPIRLSDSELKGGTEIESLIVAALVNEHKTFRGEAN